MGRHAVKLNDVAVFICQLTVFYMESAMLPEGRGGITESASEAWGYSFRRLGFGTVQGPDVCSEAALCFRRWSR